MSNHYKDSQCRMWSQLNYFRHLTLEKPSITSVYSANRGHLRNHLKTKKGILIATIVRNGKIIIPGGNDIIEVGDGVIVVTTNQHLSDLKDILI